MAAPLRAEFQEAILDALGVLALRMARKAIPSQTLKDALVFEKLTLDKARLFIPHYWALYQHDGRGPVYPRRATVLVYYADPADDPRLVDGYPVRMSDIRRLSYADWAEGWRRNRQMEADNPGGGSMQFMIVREHSGPTAPTKSYPFFEAGMQGMPEEARQVIDRAIRIEFDKLAINETDTVRLTL